VESRGLTDASGAVVLEYVRGRAVRVMVLRGMAAPPAFVMIDGGVEGETGWLAMEGASVEMKAESSR
jgi:hypothetical protein